MASTGESNRLRDRGNRVAGCKDQFVCPCQPRTPHELDWCCAHHLFEGLGKRGTAHGGGLGQGCHAVRRGRLAQNRRYCPAETWLEENGGRVMIGLRPFDPMAKRSEEHTSELQSLIRNSYAVF